MTQKPNKHGGYFSRGFKVPLPDSEQEVTVVTMPDDSEDDMERRAMQAMVAAAAIKKFSKQDDDELLTNDTCAKAFLLLLISGEDQFVQTYRDIIGGWFTFKPTIEINGTSDVESLDIKSFPQELLFVPVELVDFTSTATPGWQSAEE